MTPRLVGGIAAATFALGILSGAAGTIVVRDTTPTDLADHMGGMSASAGSMGSMAGMASMRGGDMGSMGSMMGGGSPMRPNASMGPNASMTPSDHESHHATPSPAATR